MATLDENAKPNKLGTAKRFIRNCRIKPYGRTRAVKAYQKYAWIFLLAAGLLGGAGPAFFNRAGALFGIGVNDASLPVGLFFLGFTILTVAISLTAFRHGRKWAWYLLWYVPIVYAVSGYSQVIVGQVGWGIFSTLVIPLLGLLLPYRKFFPRKVPISR